MNLIIINSDKKGDISEMVKKRFDNVECFYFPSIGDFFRVAESRGLSVDRVLLSQNAFSQDIEADFSAFTGYMLQNYFATKVFVICSLEGVYNAIYDEANGTPNIRAYYFNKGMSMKMLSDLVVMRIEELDARYGKKDAQKKTSGDELLELGGAGVKGEEKGHKGGFFSFLKRGKKNKQPTPELKPVSALSGDVNEVGSLGGVVVDLPASSGRGSVYSMDSFSSGEVVLGGGFANGVGHGDLGGLTVGGEIEHSGFAMQEIDPLMDDSTDGGVDSFGSDSNMGVAGVDGCQREDGGIEDIESSIDFESIDLSTDGSKSRVEVLRGYEHKPLADTVSVEVVKPVQSSGEFSEVKSLDEDIVLDFSSKSIEYIQPVREVVKTIVERQEIEKSKSNMFIVTGDRREGSTRTAITLAETLAKKYSKGKVLYVDMDTVRHGFLSYVPVYEYMDTSETMQRGIISVANGGRFVDTVCKFDDFKFDVLLAGYGVEVGKDIMLSASKVISLQTIYDAVVVDCPFENLDNIPDLLLFGKVLMMVGGDRTGVLNFLTLVEGISDTNRVKMLLYRNSEFIISVGDERNFRASMAESIDLFGLDETGFDWGSLKVLGVRSRLSDVIKKVC